MVGGKANPEHFRAKLKLLNDLMIAAIRNEGKIPFNYESAIKGIEREAEASGFDTKHLRDVRTADQIAWDVVEQLSAMPAAIWELTDQEIEAVEQAMDTADRLCRDRITAIVDEEEVKARDAITKRWRSRFARIKRLRNRARLEVPNYVWTNVAPEPKERDFLEAAWPLRLMIYVGRTEMAQYSSDLVKSVNQVAEHHAKMAVAVWEARYGVYFTVDPRDRAKNIYDFKPVKGLVPYQGVVLMCPPGHGKTSFGRFVVATFFIQTPKTQLLLNHAKKAEAQKNLKHLGSLFTDDNPAGRRFISLTGMRLRGGKYSAEEFKLDLPDKMRQPSAWAGGVRSKISGSNASLQWWDDPVDQQEAQAEGERDTTFQLLNGTWLTRMRGTGGWFNLITATPWHFDDAVMRFVQMSREEKPRAWYRVSVQACGGPKTSPAFKPLWKEMYPTAELRRRYESMKNPSLYACAYMMNPISDEKRIVRKLRIYDRETEEHAKFLENATKYISLDPSASRGRNSDHAGIVYLAFGSVRVEDVIDGKPVYKTEKRIRVLESSSIPATQSELVEHTIELCRSRPVDVIVVETRSGYVATAEMFEKFHGLDVRRLDPKNTNKEERLRASAPAIEDGNADLGFRAVVEFPGYMDDTGEWRIESSMEQLQNEILDFGVCTTDHMLDALTQVVLDLSPELGIGSGGTISRKVVAGQSRSTDRRVVEWLDKMEKQAVRSRSGIADDDEQHWLAQNWSMPQGGSGL